MTDRSKPQYVLDANVFIEAHKRYYAFDICPGFWKCLSHPSTRSDIVSIDHVKAEILRIEDDLSKWAKDPAREDLFADTTEQAVFDAYGRVIDWVDRNLQFQPQAKEEFARVADGWLVAYAMVYDAVLVTHEAYNEDAKKVQIPNVCKEFGVSYMNTFEMLRQLQVRFDLSQGPQ